MNYMTVIGIALMVVGGVTICIPVFLRQISQQYYELMDKLIKINNSLETLAYLLSTEQSNNQFVVDQICRIERRLKEIADNKMDK